MLKQLVISFSASYIQTLTYVSWFFEVFGSGQQQWFKLSSALKMLVRIVAKLSITSL
jgi:hypothetical protein